MPKHYGEDLRFKQDAVTIREYKKEKSSQVENLKSDLCNRERPVGLKTRKGGLGKN